MAKNVIVHATPSVALVGRKNVGKSSLFNRLIERKQALVSDIPGTTRDVGVGTCLWRGQMLTVLDTGGLAGGTRDDGLPRCPACRALEPGRARDVAAARRSTQNVIPFRPREPELRSCLGCCAPTDNPNRHCPNCQPTEETTSA